MSHRKNETYFQFLITPAVLYSSCALLCVHFDFAVILKGKRELVDLFVCLPGVSCFVALPRNAMGVCVQFVIGIFLITLIYYFRYIIYPYLCKIKLNCFYTFSDIV